VIKKDFLSNLQPKMKLSDLLTAEEDIVFIVDTIASKLTEEIEAINAAGGFKK